MPVFSAAPHSCDPTMRPSASLRRPYGRAARAIDGGKGGALGPTQARSEIGDDIVILAGQTLAARRKRRCAQCAAMAGRPAWPRASGCRATEGSTRDRRWGGGLGAALNRRTGRYCYRYGLTTIVIGWAPTQPNGAQSAPLHAWRGGAGRRPMPTYWGQKALIEPAPGGLPVRHGSRHARGHAPAHAFRLRKA